MKEEEKAIKRIETFASFDPYWVGFSGGKDSQVVLDLVKRSGVPFEAHCTMTGLDAPPLIRFIRQYYPEVSLDPVEINIKQICIQRQSIPTRMHRFCCEILKERGGIGRVVLTGVRWQESTKRKKRLMYEPSRKVDKRFVNPIIDWKTSDVWRYIYAHNLPLNPLYFSPYNYRRVGCLGCPQNGKQGKDFRLFPASKKIWMAAIDAVLKRFPEGATSKIGTRDQVFDWWLSQKSVRVFKAQGCLFFE